jgi:hypothetical protein
MGLVKKTGEFQDSRGSRGKATAFLSLHASLFEAFQRPNWLLLRLLLLLLPRQAAKDRCWYRLFLHVGSFIFLTTITTSSTFVVIIFITDLNFFRVGCAAA